jgi:hypothetical protein
MTDARGQISHQKCPLTAGIFRHEFSHGEIDLFTDRVESSSPMIILCPYPELGYL